LRESAGKERGGEHEIDIQSKSSEEAMKKGEEIGNKVNTDTAL